MNKFKEKIKHLFGIQISYYIKNFNLFLFQKKPNVDFDCKKRKIYFLDAPSYGNIGDQAIAYAIETFLENEFSEFQMIEFQENNVMQYLNWLKKNIMKNDIICLTGGGNMGDIYSKYEAIRRIIVKNFPNNKIIIFPSTIDYTNSKYGKIEFLNSKKIYNKHDKLLIIAREEKSFDIMKKEYKSNVILSPDIVLYLNYTDLKKDTKNNTKISLCLRSDSECVLKDEDRKKILDLFNDYKNISTTVNLKELITCKNRKKIVEDKLSEFANNNLVITDRLHGMIFSYSTNTPCIAINNSNGKVEGVFKWIENQGAVNFYVDEFIIPKNTKNKQIDFSSMIKKIKNFVRE